MKKKLLCLVFFIFKIVCIRAQIGLGTSTNPRTITPYFFGFNGTNTIQNDAGWEATPIANSLKNMLPGNMRYPGGSLANYWDWQTGWFKKTMPYNLTPPFSLELLNDLTPPPCKLDNYYNSVGSKGPQLVYSTNILTSDVNYQVAGSVYATSLGISLAGIEFGNELYNGFTKNPEHTVPFPTVKSYMDKCHLWADQFNIYFPTKSNSVVGNDDPGNDPLAPDYIRKLNWLPEIMSNVAVGDNIDAVTLHLYTGSGTGGDALSCGDYLKKYLTQPFKYRDSQLPNFTLIESKSKKIWVTEYNLAQKSAIKPYSLWAHGLFVAAQTLTYLERQSIELVDCHNMLGDGISSAYFQDNNGFQYLLDPMLLNGGYISVPATLAGELTASGNALSLLSKTLETSTRSEKLAFTGTVPEFTNNDNITYKLLYGFAFNQSASDPGRKQMIILNLSGNDVTIDMYGGLGTGFDQKLGGDNVAIDYEILQANPLKLITGNSVNAIDYSSYENCNDQLLPLSGKPSRYTGSITSGTFILHPYSINYFGGTYGPPKILFDRPVLCGNVSESVICYGKPPLTLTCNNSNVSISGTGPIFTVIHDGNPELDAIFTLTDGNGNTSTTALSFKSKPIITIDISGDYNSNQIVCNFPVTLHSTFFPPSYSNPVFYKYIWSPNEGLSNSLSLSTNLSQLEKVKTYQLQGYDGFCWSVPDKITITKKAYANGGADRNECINTSITLSSIDAPIGSGISYSWKILGTTTVLTTSANYTFTPILAGINKYLFTVTDGICSNSDTVTVSASACCTPGAGDYVLNPGQSISELTSAVPSDWKTLDAEFNTIITVLPGTVIQFNGDIICNQKLTISGCQNLKFAENAKITIQNQKFLKLENCILDVCTNGKFADGIYANSCQTGLTLNNCTVKHFRNAINGNFNAPVAVGNSNFTDNLVGINLKNYSLSYPFLQTAVNGDIIFGIDNNDFSAPITSELFGQTSRGLVLTSNESITLNDLSSNTFNNLYVGIYNNKSGLKVANTVFSGSSFWKLDTAIYCIGPIPNPVGKNKVEIGSTLAPNSFTTNNYSVMTNGMGAIDIHDNSFSTITYDCAYIKNAQDLVSFRYNTANIFDRALVIIDPAVNLFAINGSNNNLITNTVNEGFAPSLNRIALTITSTLTNNRPVKLNANTITARTGIYASKMTDLTCQSNVINLYRYNFSISGPESYGVRLETCDNAYLNLNTVRRYNSSTAANRLTGFYANNSINVDLQCNDFYYLRKPMVFQGSCTNQKFASSGLIGCSGGLVFNSASVSNFGSATISAGNLFSGGTGSRAEGSILTGRVYFYKNTSSYIPTPNTVPLLSLSSTASNGPLCAGAAFKNDTDELAFIAEQVEAINDSIVDAGTAFDFGAEINFYAQQSVYNQIKIDSIDYSVNSEDAELIGAFVENIAPTTIGIEHETMQLLISGSIQEAIAAAAFLPDSSVYEQNIKYVTQIILELAADSTYKISTLDSTNLKSLAYTHSLVGGPAVITSRNLLQLMVDEFIDGTTKSNKKNGDNITSSLSNLKLTPNPTSDFVSISGGCQEEASYQVEFYDLQNQLVLSKITNCQSIFAIQTLSNGLYLYNIFKNTSLVGYGKIQVLK